jgi:serine/arginine repetitive matrix protein 2
MGIPPTPTPINKRRYDNPGPTLPRTASGSQGEVMDIDPIPPTQPSTLSQPSSQFQHQYRFSMATQPTSAPPQRAAPTPLQPHGSPALGKSGPPQQPRASMSSSSGPKMGFFSESRMERRPTLPGSERTAQQPSPSLMHQQQPTPPGLMHQNLSHLTSEFVKNLKEEQERALSIQKRASQEHVPQVVQHSMFQPPAAQTSAPTGSPQLSMLDRPLERDERSGTPGVPPLAHPRAGPAMFRNILGSPGPMTSPAVNMHPPFRSAHVPSPPKREEQPMYRPGSVPVPSPATSVVKPAMSLTTGPPAEPRKTSNLASLLNSEPEEPRQKKRIGDQPTPFTQSPTPSTLSVAPSGPGSSIFARREVFNQTPVSRQEFDGRSSYPQPTSHAPTPAAQHELMTGRSGTPVGSRQPEWQSRPPMGHNLASSSPHPPAPLERDVRPYFSHRANLGSLNPQSRANPSPPPNTHPYMNHSRTPSVSGRPITPSQLQPQGPSGLSHMAQAQNSQAQSQVMQANPYSQPHGGPSHMQQIQAHQQNQFSHRHNSSGGSSHSGLHQRQTSRGEEMTLLRQQQQQQQQQEREFHMSREREHRMEVDRQYKEREAQFHQHQQQEQQRFAQHRTPQPFQQQSLSGPPQILSMREQARIEAEQGYRDARNREQYEQEMHIRRIQEDEERMRYDYRNPNGMMGRSSGGGGYGGGGAGFPPPGPHRR